MSLGLGNLYEDLSDITTPELSGAGSCYRELPALLRDKETCMWRHDEIITFGPDMGWRLSLSGA